MQRASQRRLALAACSLMAMTVAGTAHAQSAAEITPVTPVEQDAPANDIVVVGSQIKGARINEALPVTVVTTEEIRSTAAVSGDELFRSIPQFGDVRFNSQYIPGSSNSARGDVGSLDLRSLGVGNTLVLLNGRRVVNHPTSQANDQLVPVLSFNSNALPVNGLERLEVLRDGAAAIYGADAVAGVVNTVLKNNYKGGELSLQYGGGEGTGYREFNANGVVGTDFAQGRGNVTLFGSYDRGTGLLSTEQDFTASSDKTPLFADTYFAGATSLDGRSVTNQYANLRTVGNVVVRQNGTALTNASGQFHLQPTTNAGCNAAIGNAVCIQSGTQATSGVDRNLRYDAGAAGTSVIPRLDRVNLFLTGNYELSEDITAYTELGFYKAKTRAVQSPASTTTASPLVVPATSYWNPFGPATLNGAANPNRLPGLSSSAAGTALTVPNYLFADLGLRKVEVTNQQFRTLLGLRGTLGSFDWDSAASYSEAWVRDVSDNVSRTKLYQSMLQTNAAAYNIFGTTQNSAATIDGIRQDLVRYTKSSLATFDFRLSNAHLLELPGGSLGFAGGIEARRETQLDNRDARIDGTITFTDPVTGAVLSDFVDSAINPDTSGSRNVAGTYAEFAVPVISPDMHVPLIRSLDFQIAGRYEHYSDFGDVTVPKVAGAWDLVKGIRLRGSWAKSFRAPNLEQINATVVTRSNSRTDYVYCEADLRAGRIASFNNCARAQTTQARRSGNPDLDPEKATTTSVGLVLEPPLPSEWGAITVTADYWRVRQTGLVGLYGEGNALILDYLLRQSGGINPNVIRAAPTAADVDAFAGTGLAPAGQVLYVLDQYVNLQPQKVRGLDLNLTYRTPDTSIGRFNLAVNASHFFEFYQEPSPGIQELLDARAAGQINNGTVISNGGSLLEQNRKPKWRGSATLTWSLGDVTVSGFAQYTGKVFDTALTYPDGSYWEITPTTTANLYAQYRFSSGALEGSSIRLGVRNLFDTKPPLSSDGYPGVLYAPVARYWYVNVRHSF
ncbi:TonB-dependent receptor [Sphingomonas aracearum]|uniref:TonB-dependent receptor n=2 Tax=Sphingomonas aracearum TaxID=2283317 RepID=A0A369W0M9_9SPHN|nr:TonB-dependent receptor [Sphingomonas aracearum]